MSIEHTAAKPKGRRAQEDQPVREPMRGDRRITKAPSTDQKKVRRAMVRKTATELPVQAWRLNPGDYVRGPNNQVVQVRQVRPHKTDMSQVYVDTEAGTIAVPRSQNFTMVPSGRVNRQQELAPGLGLPGGNSNMLPGAPNAGGMSPGESHGQHKCPIDGSNMQLRNQGGSSVYVCPQDGYTMPAANFGFGGGGVTTDVGGLNSLGPGDHKSQQMTYGSHGKQAGEQNYDYEIHGNYGEGWEHVNTEDNIADAKRSLREYNDNEPQYPHKIKTVRRTAASENNTEGKTSALDDRPANECRLCGGHVRSVPSDSDTSLGICDDCGTAQYIQVKRTAAKTAAPVYHALNHDTCIDCDQNKQTLPLGLGARGEPICRDCYHARLDRQGASSAEHQAVDDRLDKYHPLVRHLFDPPANSPYASRYASPTGSAIARRAQAVLAQEEQS